MEVDQVEPCPYVYAKGKKCTGHIVRIEAFKVDLAWTLGNDGKWTVSMENGPCLWAGRGRTITCIALKRATMPSTASQTPTR